MSQVIDTRGLSCPQPVLLFLTAAKRNGDGPFSVLVDNAAKTSAAPRATAALWWTPQTPRTRGQA